MRPFGKALRQHDWCPHKKEIEHTDMKGPAQRKLRAFAAIRSELQELIKEVLQAERQENTLMEMGLR